MLLQTCVNGARGVSQHSWLSVDSTVVADDAARAVGAGAQESHVHPKSAAGNDSLAAGDVGAVGARAAVRVPGCAGGSDDRRVG
jgi:uncharacterized protein (DUF849 family)